MKKFLSILFATTLAVQAWAYDFQSGDLYYNITSNAEPYTAQVTWQYQFISKNYSGLSIITIPEKVTNNGIEYSVTSIGEYAFYNCSGLTSVTIPNSVTSIGRNAFYDCSGLTTVTIPESVTSIGDYAFASCNGLTSATIGNSVTSIGSSAFWECDSLTSVSIGNSVTSIGRSAFYNCNSLTSLTIPNSVTSIGDDAFAHCRSLTSVTIPESVTSIGVNAFYLVKNIVCNSTVSGGPWRALTLNGTIDGDFIYADAEKTLLTAYAGNGGNVTIPNSVTSIGDWTFSYCSGLTSVTIPNTVTSIGDGAFYYCRGLTLINIPNSVDSIGDFTFSDCSGLTSVTIPNSVTSIGYSAFSHCSGLTSITIGNSVTEIGNTAFSCCNNLISVTIPESVTSIYDYAFESCSELTSIAIPNSVTSIGSSVFYNCDKATVYCEAPSQPEGWNESWNINREQATVNVVWGINAKFDENFIYKINNEAKSITTSIYKYIGNGTSVVIPEKVTLDGTEYIIDAIESDAFRGCADLISVTIPNSIESVGSDAFYGCNNVTIYCEASSQPEGWKSDWKQETVTVIWSGNENQGGNNEGNENQGGNENNPGTAIAETAADNLQVYAHHNTIIVENATEEICVYNAMGALVGRDAIHRVRAELQVNGAGVYIVKVGNVAKRVMIND